MWKTNLVSQTTITVSALAGEFDICPRDCPVPFFVFQIVDWVLHVSEQNLYRVQCLFQCPSAKVSCFPSGTQSHEAPMAGPPLLTAISLLQVCEQLYHDGYQDAVSFLNRLSKWLGTRSR